MDRRDRSILHQANDRPELLGGELGLGASTVAVDQPVRSLGVEPQRPIAKQLPVHPAHRRRLGAAGAVINRSQGQQAPDLPSVLASPGQLPKPASVIIPSKHNRRHVEHLPFDTESNPASAL